MTDVETEAQTDKYPQAKQILTVFMMQKTRYTWVNNIVGKEHLNENVGPETTEWSRIRNKTVNEAAKDLGEKACILLTINQFCCKSLKYNLKSLRSKLKLYGDLCKLTNTARK